MARGRSLLRRLQGQAAEQRPARLFQRLEHQAWSQGSQVCDDRVDAFLLA